MIRVSHLYVNTGSKEGTGKRGLTDGQPPVGSHSVMSLSVCLLVRLNEHFNEHFVT